MFKPKMASAAYLAVQYESLLWAEGANTSASHAVPGTEGPATQEQQGF